MSQRALHLQRLLNSSAWQLAKDTLHSVVKSMEDDALNCDDPAREVRALHLAQAARLVQQRFENALALEAGEIEAENNGN